MSTTLTTTTAHATGWLAALTPDSPERVLPIATSLAKSNLIPKSYQGHPEDIIVAGAMGQRLGLDLFSALQSIAVVNGRPTLWGDAMLAVCQQHPAWEGMSVAFAGDGDAAECVVSVRRRSGERVDETVGRFSVSDAKRAGLWTKQGPWSQYPRRMLELRARAFALRGAFADALLGFHAREEMDDASPVEVQAVDGRPVRVRKSEPKLVPAETVTAEQPARVEPVAEAYAAEQADADAAARAATEAAPVEQATEQPVQPMELADLKTALNGIARTRAGGGRQMLADLQACLGYQLNGAGDIRPEDRARAVALFANESAA